MTVDVIFEDMYETLGLIGSDIGTGGTTDYTQLSNKPQINGNTLTGNKSGSEIGLVNAVPGKGLSTNDYTTAEKNKLSGIEAQANKTVIDNTLTNAGQAADAKAVGDALVGKVDKITGKQLSTEDYTTAEKTKLAGIEAQANKTVIDSTLTQTGQAADAKKTGDEIYILNVSVESLWNSVTGAGTKASNALDNEATAYNYHLQYHVGDYCLYQQKLYRCTVETPAAGETWNSSHWTAVTIGEVLSGLKTQIDNFQVATIAETKSFLGIT